MRQHVNLHILDGFSPSVEWLADTHSRLCPVCKVAVASLSHPCAGCVKEKIPDEVVLPSKPRLPALQLNHVVQLSLGTTEEALSERLPNIDSANIGKLKGSGSRPDGSERIGAIGNGTGVVVREVNLPVPVVCIDSCVGGLDLLRERESRR